MDIRNMKVDLAPFNFRVSIDMQTGHGWEPTFWFIPQEEDKKVIEEMVKKYCSFQWA